MGDSVCSHRNLFVPTGLRAEAPRAAGVAAPVGQVHVHYLAFMFNDTGHGAWPLKASYFREVCLRLCKEPDEETYLACHLHLTLATSWPTHR